MMHDKKEQNIRVVYIETGKGKQNTSSNRLSFTYTLFPSPYQPVIIDELPLGLSIGGRA